MSKGQTLFMRGYPTANHLDDGRAGERSYSATGPDRSGDRIPRRSAWGRRRGRWIALKRCSEAGGGLPSRIL